MRVGDLEARVDGIVRVMHPDTGMGVEFTRRTADQREHVEKFLHTLMTNSGALPDLLVEPEGLETNAAENSAVAASMEEMEDPLLDLFNRKATVPTEAFLSELRKQRSTQALDSESVLDA